MKTAEQWEREVGGSYVFASKRVEAIRAIQREAFDAGAQAMKRAVQDVFVRNSVERWSFKPEIDMIHPSMLVGRP